MMSTRKLVSLLVVAVSLAGCGEVPSSTEEGAGEPPQVQARQQQEDWATFAAAFVDEYYRRNPESAVYAGLHAYDGQARDYSAEGQADYLQWLDAMLAATGDYPDDTLTGAERFERDYLASRLRSERFFIVDADYPGKNPLYYINAISASVYVTREYAPIETRRAAYTRYLSTVPGLLAAMRATIRPPIARPHAETALGILDGLKTYLGDTVPALLGRGAGDDEAAALRAATESAIASIEASREWLAGATVDDNFALGEARFLKMLADAEGLDIDLAALKAAGEKDLERNLAALGEACAQLAPSLSVADCIAEVSADKPMGGAVAGARRQLPELRRFVESERLVSIPGDEEALVDEAPPHRRFNFAYIEIPGQYETGLPSVYYIAPPDPAWPEEMQTAYIPDENDLLFTSIHEVWPGHFLQYLHKNRTESLIGRTFSAYSFSEGWAHYVEEMMLEAGIRDRAPAVRIGQLLNALLRNVRYLSAIGLHAEGMTVEESKQMFLDKAFQDEGNASQQANRGTRDPGYLNYTLGKLMIRKLREDYTRDRGGRDAWLEFHDRLLAYGSPPVPLLRRELLGEDYTGDPNTLP